MHKITLPSLATALAVLLVLTIGAPAAGAYTLNIEPVAEDLNHPWALVFLPDGDMLISERAGQLRRLSAVPERDGVIQGTPVAYVASQGGYQDLALHPDHVNNGWIYLTLAVGSADANATQLVRGRLDALSWVDEEVLFTAQPSKSTPVHYGARMAFLPDQTLLLSVGDGFDYREAAQDMSSHLGKLLRLNDDGSVPDDNPFVGQSGVAPEIFTLGHRNAQGIVFDDVSGHIWSHEHGPRRGDELNLIVAGGNYGWPVVTAGRDYTGAQITPFRSRPNMMDPAWVWSDTVAPAGLALYRGALFSEWNGQLLVAGLVDRDLRRLVIDGLQVIADHPLNLGLNRRLRDVRIGPDGAIYVLTDESKGEVLRITPDD